MYFDKLPDVLLDDTNRLHVAVEEWQYINTCILCIELPLNLLVNQHFNCRYDIVNQYTKGYDLIPMQKWRHIQTKNVIFLITRIKRNKK